MTIKEATHKWVNEYMNSFPQGMIVKLVRLEPDAWHEITLSDDEPYDFLPMWGTMWQFSDWLDTEWIKNHGGLQALSDCGFRVYDSDEFGYFFGIDGAGYDFYESHWIPLYKARGLKWHEN